MYVAEHLLDEELLLAEEMAVESARRSLLDFTLYTKPDYEVNWHHRVVADALTAVADGRIKRLIISMPPRAGKSELVSRRFPAYYLGRNPDHQILAASYSSALAKKMNRDVQRIIDSEPYSKIFPGVILNSGNVRATDQGSWLRNSDEFEIVGRMGLYRASGVGAAATGYGSHLGICDDPVRNRQDANSITYRNTLYDWYTSTFYSRLEKGGAIVLCMTRWSDDDLCARVQNLAAVDPTADQWHVVSLPQIREDLSCDYDPRPIGGVLWPNKYSPERVASMRATMGERDWASLHQQRPAPLAGNLIKREWWQFYSELPHDLDAQCISCDLNMKPGNKSDFTVMQIWGRKGGNFYLLGQVRGRMGWLDQKRTLPQLHHEWPQASPIYVEDAANGPALIAELKATVPGIVPVSPKGDKYTRLEAVSALIEAGNVFLPDPARNKWVHEVIEETAVFPNGAHDDICDTLSQALSQMRLRMRNWSAMAPRAIPKVSNWLRP